MTNHKNPDSALNQPVPMELSEIRDGINQVDYELIDLLRRRRELSLNVARNKELTDNILRDQNREQELLAKLIKLGKDSGLEANYVMKLFHAIIDDSLTIQRDYFQNKINPEVDLNKQRKISILGGNGSYSFFAAQQFFTSKPEKNIFLGCDNFEEVIRTVEDGEAEYAVLPIENTTSGGINEVYDLLLNTSLSIVGEEKFQVQHCLIGKAGTKLEEITSILTHPEAKRQCSHYIAHKLNTKIDLQESTAHAADMVSNSQTTVSDKNSCMAAIASEETAKLFGLEVLEKNIANQKENWTRFVIASAKPGKASLKLPCKTSLVLSTGQKPGSLAEALLLFRDQEITLTKLESRPILGKPWEQMFYLDLEGNISDPRVKSTLEELTRLCRFVKVMGCYPVKSLAPTRLTPNQLAHSQANVDKPLVTQHTSKPSARKSYHLASREHNPHDTIIEVKGVKLGGDQFTVISGPCSVESFDQIMACAKHASEHGSTILRGGCFKPRTSPYSFQGLEYEGLDYIVQAGETYGMPIITEVMNTKDVQRIALQADMLQIGARNMQNFSLLKAVGKINKPVMLKRGLMSSLDELLNAAEYILSQGNLQVFLCERGIRTFETATRNTLDLSAIPILKQKTHLPVIVDPSHAVGQRDLVIPMAKAAKAVGAHGIMIEFHPNPEKALSDGPQALRFEQFAQLMRDLYPSIS